jgi:predicted nucleotidyltransferase
MDKKIFFQIKKIAARLKKKYNAEQVILFGSYASGEEKADSDVDLLIIAPTTEPFYQRMATTLQLVRDLYRELPISPIVLRPEEIEKRRRRGDQFVQEIIEEGVKM